MAFELTTEKAARGFRKMEGFISENPDTDTVKCGVYRRDIDRPNKGRTKTGLDYLREAVTGSKIWITNSPAGYSPALEKFLADYYQI